MMKLKNKHNMQIYMASTAPFVPDQSSPRRTELPCV